MYMRLGPEGRSVGAEFRVTNVRTPIHSMGILVKQGYRFEATLDVVKNSLWVEAKAYTAAEGACNVDARLVAPVLDGLPEK